MGQLDGKVALVTAGGAGIGQATVWLLAERGASVVAADIDVAGLEETKREAKAAERIRTLVADATSLEGAESAVEAVLMAVEADLDKGLDAKAQHLAVQQGDVAADDAAGLELFGAAQTGRGREADLLGQIDIGDAALGLEDSQDSQIAGR